MNNYGKCDRCGTDLIAGDHVTIDESKIVDGRLYYTGKKDFCNRVFTMSLLS